MNTEAEGGLEVLRGRIGSFFEAFQKDEKDPTLLLRAHEIKEDLKSRGIKLEVLGLETEVVDVLNRLSTEFHFVEATE